MFGIDLSVTKHVLMLWIVAAMLFVGITWLVRRYLRQDRLIPDRCMTACSRSSIEFVRDSIVEPNVGNKWVTRLDAAAADAVPVHLRRRT